MEVDLRIDRHEPKGQYHGEIQKTIPIVLSAIQKIVDFHVMTSRINVNVVDAIKSNRICFHIKSE